MKRLALIALLLATSAVAQPYDPYRDGPFFGDPRWPAPPRRAEPVPIPHGTPHGAVTPMGEVAYPLNPGWVQAPVHMRKAYPNGVPPYLAPSIRP